MIKYPIYRAYSQNKNKRTYNKKSSIFLLKYNPYREKEIERIYVKTTSDKEMIFSYMSYMFEKCVMCNLM